MLMRWLRIRRSFQSCWISNQVSAHAGPKSTMPMCTQAAAACIGAVQDSDRLHGHRLVMA